MYNGMNDAGGAIGDQIGTLSDVFATVTTEDDTIVNILIDIVTIGYGQFAAALWNKVLKDAAFFTANAARKNDHGWYKDVGIGPKPISFSRLAQELLPRQRPNFAWSNFFLIEQ